MGRRRVGRGRGLGCVSDMVKDEGNGVCYTGLVERVTFSGMLE